MIRSTLVLLALLSALPQADGQTVPPLSMYAGSPPSGALTTAGQDSETTAEPQLPRNVWGLDVLISNDGFGLGGFYRRELSPDVAGFVSLSISEAKDEREVERFDPYWGVSFTPGKLNRFLVIPLMVGLQYRLFREDIMDTFRPYVNAGAGPAMIYQMPFVDFVETGGYTEPREVDFFKSIGRGHPHWTGSAFVGAGANFGTDRSNLFGVNFRYYFTYIFSEGLPSLYNTSGAPGTFGTVAARKKNFGGFFITLNIGMGV